jgi:hypothetical protein
MIAIITIPEQAVRKSFPALFARLPSQSKLRNELENAAFWPDGDTYHRDAVPVLFAHLPERLLL